jgi:hypothetical protein
MPRNMLVRLAALARHRVAMHSGCSYRGTLAIFMPFIALLMVAGSISHVVPHEAIVEAEDMHEEIRRFVSCYRLVLARMLDPFLAFARAMEVVLGKDGRVAARSYIITYNTRGDRLLAVKEFTDHVLKIFSNYIKARIMLVTEVSKLVVLLIAMNVLVVSFSAFITINTAIVSAIVVLAVLISFVLPLVVDLHKVTRLIVRRNQLAIDGFYIIILLFSSTLALGDISTVSALLATLALALSVLRMARLYRSLNDVRETRLLVKEIGEEYATTGRLQVSQRSHLARLIVGVISGETGTFNPSWLPPLHRVVAQTVSRLLYGGTYRHTKVVENILEDIEEALRQTTRLWLALSLTLIIVYVTSVISSLVVVNLFHTNNIANAIKGEAAGGMGISLIHIEPRISSNLINTFTLVNALAVSAIALSLSAALLGTISSPAAPAVLLAYLALRGLTVSL